MDQGNETGAQEQIAAAGDTRADSPLHPEIQDSGRTAVFTALVKGDTDVTGLVAYSVFKQNELDWLSDFRKARGREPTEGEADSYIIGESTPRRLATYRHLAEATLAGKGPDVVNGGSAGSSGVRAAEAKQSGGFGASAFVYVLLAIVVLVGVYFAARYGAPR